jgi:hypothetical protein
MFCTQCGHKNPEGAHFCANCGAALTTTPDDSTTTISLAAQDLEAEVEEEVVAPVEELRENTAMLVAITIPIPPPPKRSARGAPTTTNTSDATAMEYFLWISTR